MTNPFDSSSPRRPGEPRRVAVLGAGPVGLEVALAARDRGFAVRLYEAASTPAGNVRRWGHVRLFTPWRLSVSPRMRETLARMGRPLELSNDECPTGHELADRVLDPIGEVFRSEGSLRLATRVVSVGREGTLKHEEIGTGGRARHPFRILVEAPGGEERTEHADLVFDCTGKHGNPNRLGDGGIPAPGERAVADRIGRRIPDLAREGERWAGRTILLVGAGHSAQTAARDLAELASERPGTRVLWSVRAPEPDWGAVADDPLPARRALTDTASELAGGASPALRLAAGTTVDRIGEDGDGFAVRLRPLDGSPVHEEGRGDATSEVVRVDRVLGLTGGVGDHELYRQLQVHECYATCGPMKLAAALLGSASDDCLEQESHGADTLVNPEPGFYILGDKSYGRNSTFLLRTGWSQVDEVFRGPEARARMPRGAEAAPA